MGGPEFDSQVLTTNPSFDLLSFPCSLNTGNGDWGGEGVN